MIRGFVRNKSMGSISHYLYTKEIETVYN